MERLGKRTNYDATFPEAMGIAAGKEISAKLKSKHGATFKIPQEITFDKLDKYYDSKKGDYSNLKSASEYANLQKYLHFETTFGYRRFNPHVGGYYYIQLVPGTWINQISGTEMGMGLTLSGKESWSGFHKNDNDRNFAWKLLHPNYNSNMIKTVHKHFGKFATDIDIPQFIMEYESISGKNRNLNYASKIQYGGDFSITFLENWSNDIFRYHKLWIDYITLLRKGYIELPPEYNKNVKTNDFIPMPYLGAVWVTIHAPFTNDIRGLIKIMGASPVNLPFKEILGDRGNNHITTFTLNYKSTDMIFKFYETDSDLSNCEFFQEYLKDMTTLTQKFSVDAYS